MKKEKLIKVMWVVAFTIGITLMITGFVTPFPDVHSSNTSKDLGLEHLKEIMDKYHSEFDVYTDLSAAGNHFVMLAKMGKDVEINPGYFENPYSGATCIENKFNGIGTSWGGWYFMNGILEGEEVQPKPNWGESPNAGFNLTGATKLTFWARGKEGGERVEFFAFGVGRDVGTCMPIAPYPDSSHKKSLGYITLSKEWQQYTINLSQVNLSYILGGFGWVTNALQNKNKLITFYLDDIKYDKKRLDEPRFLVSYKLLPNDKPVLKNIAFTYDNALALLAFLAGGTEEGLKRAKLIGDAFVYAIDHDRYFTDGRIRNAYQGGDLKLFPGWKPHGKSDTVRMPGWWDIKDNKWYEDRFAVSTHTGNVAWTIISLLSLYEETGDDKYLNASIILGEWIEKECRDGRGAGGYTGGYEGWEQTIHNPKGQTKLLWKSTEHNIDVYVAFARLYKLTKNEVWKERALHAKNFVEAMWDEEKGHFWTGTLEDGVTINKITIPIDIQAWSLMAMDEIAKYKRGIEWVENNCYVEAYGFKGFDFNNDRDGVWFEGTAHMVIAYQILGNGTKANFYLNELRRAQKEANNTNGKGIVAASHDNVSTGFEWVYDARLHVGATAWFIFAELGYNPFWNTPSVNCSCVNCADCTEKLNNPLCAVVNLAANITNHTETCINNPANFNNKTFDCQGFTIDGDDVGTDFGIFISGKKFNTIRNCITTGFAIGVFLNSSSNNTLTNNTANDNQGGIVLFMSSNNTLTNNTANNNNYTGIYLYNASNNGIVSNIVRFNKQHGFYALATSTGNILNLNIFCSNNQSGGAFYDIYSADANIGSNNTCDSAFNFNDIGTTGCAYKCTTLPAPCTPFDLDGNNIIDIFDVVAGLEHLSFGSPIVNERCSARDQHEIDIFDLFILIEKINS